MRPAILHHHLAVDVAGLIRNQKAGEIGEFAVFADTPERIFGRRILVAVLGPKLSRCTGNWKNAGANGSRECAPDDRLREAIQSVGQRWIASSQALLAIRTLLLELLAAFPADSECPNQIVACL